MLPRPLTMTSANKPRPEERYPATYPPTVMPVKIQSLVTGPAWGPPHERRREITGGGVRQRNPGPQMIERANGLSASHHKRMAVCALAGLFACRLAPVAALLADEGQITAVSARASDDYVRVKLADGTFKTETYTFGNGGRLPGSARDDTIDKLTFEDVAKTIVEPLAKRNYAPQADHDPNKTDFLIMVYWGTTTGTEDTSGSAAYENLQANQQSSVHAPPPPPSMSGHGGPSGGAASAAIIRSQPDNVTGEMASVAALEEQREQADMRNAQLLGYDSELAQAGRTEIATFKLRRDDLMSEIEQNRYFVVLMAYDFQALWKQKKHRLVWVTRMSVRERGGDFAKILPSMVTYSSQFFGQDTRGLVRKPLPEGHVEVGEPKSLGVVPEK